MSQQATATNRSLQSLETIYQHLKACEPEEKDREALLAPVAGEIRHLQDHLGLSREEAWVFAMLFHLCIEESNVGIKTLRKFLQSSNAFVLGLLPVMRQLLRKRLVMMQSRSIIKRKHNALPAYSVPAHVIATIAEGGNPATDLKCANYMEWLNEMGIVAEQYESGDMDDSSYDFTLEYLLAENRHIEEVAYLQSFNLPLDELKLLLVLLVKELEEEGEHNISHLLDHVSQDLKTRARLKQIILNERTQLQRKGYLALAEADFFSGDVVQLTDHGRHELLDLPPRRMGKGSGFKQLQRVKPADIQEKELYFNPVLEAELARVRHSCQPRQYEQLTQRMQAAGFKPGLTILLHGEPGTGKTESCYQLARHTGRELLIVDMSGIKDKYIGESEKRVKGIFREYKKACEELNTTPILLLNEADALITSRARTGEDSNHAVTEMYNTMQNILLQSLEDFEGILIATTNFAVNFDAAFERRFLFKLPFEAPNQNARKHIWQQHFPDLSDPQLEQLVRKYDLTGAQIANVAKRAMLERVVDNREVDLARIGQLVEMEKGLAVKGRRVVGFGR